LYSERGSDAHVEVSKAIQPDTSLYLWGVLSLTDGKIMTECHKVRFETSSPQPVEMDEDDKWR